MAPATFNQSTPDQPLSTMVSAEKTPGISPRIQPLDVLRAVAVLGGLLVSVWIFGGFTNNKQLQLLLNPHGKNYIIYSTVVLLFQGKMLALISLVFGAGMVLYLNQQNKRSSEVADLFIRRQVWLLGFGLLNALLFLWTDDVLFHLAIMGILLFPFVQLSSRGLLIASIVATAIFCGKNYWKYSDDKKAYNKYLAVTAYEKKLTRDSIARVQKVAQPKDQKNAAIASSQKDSLSKQQKADKQAWEGMLKNMKYDPKKDEGENKEMQATSFGALWDHLLPSIQNKEAQWTYKTGIWDIASMMFLGMALLKFGVFGNRFTRNQYLVFAIATLAAGLLLGWYRLHYNQVAVGNYTKYIIRYWLPYNFFFPFEKFFIAIGYASLLMVLVGLTRLDVVWKALASVGRLGLTNYLLQSIICSLFFTGYGMGYFGRLPQYQLYLLVGEIWIVQIVFSVLWLRKFEYGPAEWLWRCLTYMKLLPIKKNTAETNQAIVPSIS